MTPENIPNWNSHDAKAGETYQLMFIADRAGAQLDPGEFGGVLEQRRGLDVMRVDAVGAYARARVFLLAPGKLGTITGTYVVTGPDSRSAVTWKLVQVHLVENAPFGSSVLTVIPRAGEWIKDQLGNAATGAARTTGQVANDVLDDVTDPLRKAARALVPTEIWVAIGVIGALALLSFTTASGER